MPDTPDHAAALAANETQSSGIVLAFDFGRRRIGVATANLSTRTATPLRAIEVGSEVPWEKLDRMLAEWRPQQLVIGTPESSVNRALPAAIALFATALEARYALPVALVDEELTSHAARSELAERRRSGFLRRQVRRGKVDSLAACLIAEQWLAGDTRAIASEPQAT
jgi:putative pre-16S rRNA nuclease